MFHICCVAYFILLLASANLSAQQQVSSSIDSISLVRRPGWSSTPFIAVGYGTPQGVRIEAGYRFGEYFAIGLLLGIYDNWSPHPEDGSGGYFASLHLPIGNKMALHTFAGMGEAFSRPDNSYWMLSFGITYPVNSFLTLRPEFGIVKTFRTDESHYSRASRHPSLPPLTGVYSYVIKDPVINTRFGVHITLEVDLRPLYGF